MANTQDPIKLLDSIKKYFDAVAISSKAMYKGMSKKQKAQSLTQLTKDLLRADNAVLELTDDSKDFFKVMDKGSKTSSKSTKKLTNELNKQNKSLKDNKKSMNNLVIPKSVLGQAKAFAGMQALWYPIKAFTFKMLAIPGNVLSSTAEYGDLLRQVASVSGMTATSLKELDSVIKDVGTSTKFSMLETAKATKTLAQAGFRDEEITSALKPIALLATATSATIAESTNLTSTVLRAYGKSASDFGEITDSLANAVVNSRLSLQDLNVAFGYVASAAAQTGVTFQETIALLGTLANSGLKATTAATGLRMMLLKLAAPTRKAQKVLDSVGLNKDQLDASKVGIKNVIKELDKLSRTNIIDIFGARSANVVLSLLNTGEEAIGLLQKSVEASGTAARMAEEQLLSLKQSWKVFQDTVVQTEVGFGQSFSTDLAVDLRTITTVLKDFNKTLPKSVNIMKGFRIGFIALVSVITSKAILTSVKKLSIAFVRLRSAMIHLQVGNAALASFALGIQGAFTVAIASVIALTAIIGAFIYKWYEAKRVTEEYVTSLTKVSIVFQKTTSSIYKFRSEFAKLEHIKLPEVLFDFEFKLISQKSKETLDNQFKELAEIVKGTPETVAALEKAKKEADEIFYRAFTLGSTGYVQEAYAKTEVALRKIRKDHLKRLIEILQQEAIVERIVPGAEGQTYDVVWTTNLIKRRKALKKQLALLDSHSTDLETSAHNSVELARKMQVELNELATSGDVLSLEGMRVLRDSISEYSTKLEPLFAQAAITPTSDAGQDLVDPFKDLLATLKYTARIAEIILSEDEVSSIFSSVYKEVKAGLTDASKKGIEEIKQGITTESADVSYQNAINEWRKSFISQIKATLEEKGIKEGEIDLVPFFKLVDENIKKKTTEYYKTSKLSGLEYTISVEKTKLALEKTKLGISGETHTKIAETKEEIKKLTESLINFNYQKDLADPNVSIELANLNKELALKKTILEVQKKATKLTKEEAKSSIELAKSTIDNLKSLRDFEQDEGNSSRVRELNDQILDYTKNLHKAQLAMAKDLDKISGPQLDKMIEKFRLEEKELEKTLKNAGKIFRDFKNDTKDVIIDGFSGLFDELIEGTESVSDAFKDMAEDILKSMASLVANKLMTNAVDGLFGMLPNGLSGGGSEKTGYESSSGILQTIVGAALSGIGGAIGSMFTSASTSFAGSSAFDSSNYSLGNTNLDIDLPSWATSAAPTFGGLDLANVQAPSTFAVPSITIHNNAAVSVVPQIDTRTQNTAFFIEDLNTNGPMSQQIQALSLR